jgi:hypothetical protein
MLHFKSQDTFSGVHTQHSPGSCLSFPYGFPDRYFFRRSETKGVLKEDFCEFTNPSTTHNSILQTIQCQTLWLKVVGCHYEIQCNFYFSWENAQMRAKALLQQFYFCAEYFRRPTDVARLVITRFCSVLLKKTAPNWVTVPQLLISSNVNKTEVPKILHLPPPSATEWQS